MKKILLGIGGVISFVAMAKLIYATRKEAEENGKKCRKYIDYYQIFNKWVANNNQKLTNEFFLKSMNLKTVAVYGKGEIGTRLIESLEGTSIYIQCIIEKKANGIVTDAASGIKTVGLDDLECYSDVDAIIVTPMFDFENIKKEIIEKGFKSKIISIEDLIFYDMI